MADFEQQSLGREESWQQVNVGGPSIRFSTTTDMRQSQSDGDEALTLPGSSFSFNSRVLPILFPHKSGADRVYKRVEEFAILLDEWLLARDITTDDATKRGQTVKFIQTLQGSAEEFAQALKKECDQGGETKISKNWQGRIKELGDNAASTSQPLTESAVNGHGSGQDSITENLQKAQAEAHTWNLFGRLVDFLFPNPTIDVEQGKKDFLEMRGEITNETPNSEIWERFIFTDDDAREKHIVLGWLENCAAADDAGQQAEILSKLETTAGIDHGAWTHGWMNTRERLKAQKRMVAVTTSLRGSAPAVRGSDEMVSELDPDAVARQGRSLERVDDIYERSLWVACFFLLRNGASWEDIRTYAEDRNEAWRAASFGTAPDEKDARTGLAGPVVGTLWRRMCFAAARRMGASEYERAVYGLLAGDIDSVEPVCRSWDDHLFAYYNALLIASFESHLVQECPERLSLTVFAKFPRPSQAGWPSDTQELMSLLKQHNASNAEARTCAKLVQAHLLSRTFPEFAREVGIAMSKDANSDGVTPLIPVTTAELTEDYEDLKKIIADGQAVRMIVHLILIYEAFIGRLFADSPADRVLIENIFVWYLNFLRNIKKIEAIPTYARFVTQPRREDVVGVIMADLTDARQQRSLVGLMKGSHLYIPRVLAAHLEFALARMNLNPGAFEPILRIDITEPTDNPVWPGERIKSDFVQSPLAEEEDMLVQAAEWFLHIHSQWQGTFDALMMVLKAFLLSGRWTAAVEFTRRIPFSVVSKQKSVSELGQAVDVFQEQEIEFYEEIVEEQSFRRTTRASSRQPSLPPSQRVPDEYKQTVLEILRLQSKQCLEMQQICLALDKLSTWRAVEEQLPARGLLTAHSEKLLRSELDELTAAMEPLLQPGFMTAVPDGMQPLIVQSKTRMLIWCAEDEKEDYAHILAVYVPPIVLAYNSARAFAAAYLGGETILPALELANVVADEENGELQRAFVQTGRMGEFVTALAHTSRCLLNVNQDTERREKVQRGLEMGRRKKRVVRKKSGLKKRGWMGETVGIWDPSKVV